MANTKKVKKTSQTQIVKKAQKKLPKDFEKMMSSDLSESARIEMLKSLQSSEHSMNICRQVVVSLRYLID